MQPLERGSFVAVVEVAVDEPKELVRGLRPAGVGIKARLYLGKKTSNTAVRSEEEGRSEGLAFRTKL